MKAPFFASPLGFMLGLGRNFDIAALPIHGLRHPPAAGTTGWFIWSGEYAEDDDFFVPIHVHNLQECCPTVIRYLGLPPGWRFLIADQHEDIWFDHALLEVS